MNVTFLGAAGTVTGSRHLVTANGRRLLVDCGLLQGPKALRLRNWAPLGVDPQALDGVVLTHAHLDHTGYLPVLVREGFRGPIYCTPPTADLVQILLADSGHLQEEDARYANKKGYSRHHPAEPLYTVEDARAVTELLHPVEPGQDIDVDGWTLRFGLAGHILGATWVRITDGARSILFSGDIGRHHDLLMPAPEPPLDADVVVMESTYGGRVHPPVDPVEVLGQILKDTAARGGVLMVPAFAVGRAQLVLYALAQAQDRGLGRGVPMFLNSPMAIDVTRLYSKHDRYHRLDHEETAAVFARARYVQGVEESKELNRRNGPMVLVAGAGMLTGGRILHHIKAFGGDDRNTLLLTGHQAEGTRGADLLRGAPTVKIHGHMVPIRAEVRTLDGMSGHGDRDELTAWLSGIPRPPERVYLVHGDGDQAEALRTHLVDTLGWDARVAVDGAVEPI